MTITINNYNFDGPFTSENGLKQQSGVYVVLGNNGSGNWNVVDVGESNDVKTRVSNHDRADCWKRQGYSNLAAAAYYTNEANRMAIEKELRAQFNPPCGKR
jgi:hypothetical protein